MSGSRIAFKILLKNQNSTTVHSGTCQLLFFTVYIQYLQPKGIHLSLHQLSLDELKGNYRGDADSQWTATAYMVMQEWNNA